MSVQSLKATILSAEDIKYEDVTIPEWGGVKVRIKGLSDAQHGEHQTKAMALRTKQGDGNLDIEMRNNRASLIVKCLYDPETGKRIFDDSDYKALAAKNAGVVQAIFAVIQKLSGLDKTFERKVKEAEGNSGADPS